MTSDLFSIKGFYSGLYNYSVYFVEISSKLSLISSNAFVISFLLGIKKVKNGNYIN